MIEKAYTIKKTGLVVDGFDIFETHEKAYEEEEWKQSIKEEKMKNFNENTVRRIEKAFPELDRDEILGILTKSDTCGNAFEECIKDTEPVPASRYYVIIGQLKDGYPCEKLEFLSRHDMLVFYDDVLNYFRNHILTYGHIDVCTLKDYFKKQNNYLYTESYLYERFADADYGWKSITNIEMEIFHNMRVIVFSEPERL